MDKQIQEDMKRLVQLYSRLKSIMAEAIIISERHSTAEKFCKIIHHAVQQIDEGAHNLFKDAYVLKEVGEKKEKEEKDIPPTPYSNKEGESNR